MNWEIEGRVFSNMWREGIEWLSRISSVVWIGCCCDRYAVNVVVSSSAGSSFLNGIWMIDYNRDEDWGMDVLCDVLFNG